MRGQTLKNRKMKNQKTKTSRLFEDLLFYFVEQEEIPEEANEEVISDLDKVFRLKKIYSRLISISKILDHHSDDKFEELRSDILEGIDLFHIIVSNFDNFKDSIDDIIESFYGLLKSSVKEIDKLTKKTGE